MSGSGLLAKRHQLPSPAATASRSGPGRSATRHRGAAPHPGSATAEAELDIETALSLAPQADIEVYEGGASAASTTSSARSSATTRPKIVSASWTNGCEAYVGQSVQNSENTLFQAAAVGRAVDLRRLAATRVRRAATSTADRGHRRAPTRWRRPSTPRPAPCTSPTRGATWSAWTARAARAARRTSPRGLGDHRHRARRSRAGLVGREGVRGQRRRAR